MAEREWGESVDPLEAELRDLGRHLDVPPPPDVAAAVRARLAAGDDPESRRRGRWEHPVVKAAAVLAVVFAGLLVVSPQVRAAVVDLFRFAGIEFHQGEESPVPVDGRYAPLPGERTTDLDVARATVEFRIWVPDVLGPPDLVVAADGDPPRVISLLYFAGPGRPPVEPGSDGPALRIDQFQGSISPVFDKYLTFNAEPVALGSYLGFWLDEAHPVLYVDRTGDIREESARMSAKTLVVEAGGTTLRIEGELTKERAIEIAHSLVEAD